MFFRWYETFDFTTPNKAHSCACVSHTVSFSSRTSSRTISFGWYTTIWFSFALIRLHFLCAYYTIFPVLALAANADPLFVCIFTAAIEINSHTNIYARLPQATSKPPAAAEQIYGVNHHVFQTRCLLRTNFTLDNRRCRTISFPDGHCYSSNECAILYQKSLSRKSGLRKTMQRRRGRATPTA